MNNEQFDREKQYQLSLTIAKSMKEKAIITAEEYSTIDTILLKKYRPILGGLQAGNVPESLAI